jgi:tight adherence protein C
MSDAALTGLTAVAALLGAAASAAILGWAVAASLGRLLRGRVGAGLRGRSGGSLPLALRLAATLVAPLTPALRVNLPDRWHRRLGSALRRAGVDAEVQPVAWCLLPLPWLIAVALLAAATPWSVTVFALGGIVSLTAPWVWLRETTRRREATVLRELPLHLDLLALSLESGATLLLALRTSLPRAPPGPFREALTGLLGDLQTGRTRTEAIHALQRRVDFGCVQPLTTAMIQAERSGAGLAELLRLQSEQRSHERFHRAEQLAMQAPVKMLGPLVLCIFPGTFIVLAFVVFVRVNG